MFNYQGSHDLSLKKQYAMVKPSVFVASRLNYAGIGLTNPKIT